MRNLGDNLLACSGQRTGQPRSLTASATKSTGSGKRRKTYANTVSAAYRHDPFGGSLADFSLQLRADRNDARDTKRDLQRLCNRGLSGSLLRQLQVSGNRGLIDELSRQSPREIRQYEKLFTSTNTALRHLGESTGAVFGRQIEQQVHAVQDLRKVMNRLDQRLRP